MGKINLDTIEGLSLLKENLNNVINDRITEAKVNAARDNVKDMTIGEMKHLFECVSDKLYDMNEGKAIIKDYVKTIKENRELKDFYNMFDVVRKANGVTNTDAFLNEALTLVGKPSRKSVMALRPIMENIISTLKLTDDDVATMNEGLNKVDKSLSYILSENKTKKNLVEYSNNMSIVSEAIRKNTVNEDSSVTVDDVNDVLSECTETWEQNVMNDVVLYSLSGKGRQELFEDYKNACLSMIDENMEQANTVEEKNSFSVMREGLTAKTFNHDTYADDMMKLSELKETLKNN